MDKHGEEMLDLQRVLAGHDWYYAFSDDHSVWSRGNDVAKTIRIRVNKLGRDGERLLQAHKDIHFGPHTGFTYVYPEDTK